MNKENVKKLYPLTAAQRLHFYTLKFCPQKQVLNIGSSLVIKEELDWNMLKKAIYEAYERCEAMRIRFTEDENGNVMQYIAEKEEREIEYFDFNGITVEDAKNIMREWTEVPFERYDTPLNKVVMINSLDDYRGLYLLVDHMTMDAQSLIVFLKDIIEIYCHMRYEGIPYPEEMSSYIDQIEKDLLYEKGCKSRKRDEMFFMNLLEETEPIFCDIDGVERLEKERVIKNNPKLRAVKNVNDNVDANITVFSLDEYASNRLLKFCEDNGVSMVCLLMMGLRTYLQKVNYSDDVSIMSTIARRATLLEKHCGGTRIHCFPCRTIINKDKTFIEGIQEIQKAQNKLFRHADYDPVECLTSRAKRYNNQPGETYEPLSLTYQPLTLKGASTRPGQTVDFGDIEYKTDWYSNGVCAHALYLTVMHRATDNGLDFNFEYQTGRVNSEKLENMYYYICKILFAGISDANRTIGEIIESV